MTWTEVFQLTQALASLATVALVILAWHQIKLVGKQSRTNFEDSLNDQYRRILEGIPTDVLLGAELKTIDGVERRDCRHAIYRYIDLSNEQAFLFCKKRITAEAWAEWSDGIKSNMELPAFREVWEEVSTRLPQSFKEFRTLLDGRRHEPRK